MGKQVGFYAASDDFRDLLQRSEETGLLAIPEIIPADTTVEPVKPTEFRLPADQEFFYLFPGEFGIGDAIYEEMESEAGSARLMSAVSPVIEVTPCKQTDNRLYNGRIYLGIEPDDELYPTAERSFNKLARSIRRWPKTDQFGFFVGPRTADQAKRKEIRLMHHETELHVR
jgi:hypothetical protein